MGEQVRAGSLDLWVERRGQGPEVLIIAALGDPVEAWQLQQQGLQDHYRLTAFDSRGVGRTPMPAEPVTVAALADDAAALLGRWRSRRPTSSATPPGASSPRNWPCGIPSWSAAWS